MSRELQGQYPDAWAALFAAWVVALTASLGPFLLARSWGNLLASCNGFSE